MKLPDVVHPMRFRIKGIVFKVVSYVPLSDRQAGAIAKQFYRMHKFTKKHQGREVEVLWLEDPSASS